MRVKWANKEIKIFSSFLKVAVGSGLRYDIWNQIKPRFGDMWLWEIYGSTEGNVQLANVMDDEACIMRFTPIVQVIFSTLL